MANRGNPKAKRKKKSSAFKRRPEETRKAYYNRYIRSKKWFSIRNKTMMAAEEKCIICDEEALHVHHWRYPEVLGTEKKEWLSAVCYRCHGIIHDEYKDDLRNIQDSKASILPSLASIVIDCIQEDLIEKEVDVEYLAITC